MPPKQKGNDILQRALNTLQENFALPLKIETEEIQQPEYPETRADYLLRIKVNETEIKFYAEIKTNITTADIAIKLILHKDLNQFLFVTRYATGEIADRLMKKNIQFIDMAGNAYINQPPIYIFVKGNRLTEGLRPTPVKRAFKPTGLKLIYVLLCTPGLENKPYREIAAKANVALGTVVWIIRDLKELGHMLDMGKRGNKLIDKEKLLERWTLEYRERLMPKLILGRYRGKPGWWEQTTLNPDHAQWGGEVAAARLTQYLKPQDGTLYIDPARLNQICLDNRLAKDPNGNTEILERFWKPDKNQTKEETVHPILVYADLLATGNQRNIETAKMIYEQYIVRLIRED